MWTYLLSGLLQDKLGNSQSGLEEINKAIDHTCTLPDLYAAKGKVLKHLGDLRNATKAYNKARKLDMGDRFLNNKTAKYLLRENLTEEAEKIMALFSKERGN